MPQILSDEQLFCLEGCRTYKQYYNTRKGFESGKCVFCEVDRDFNNIEYEDEHVLAWCVPVDYGRSSVKYHLIVIPKRHVRFFIDLTKEELLSIQEAHRHMHRKHGYEGGMLHVREGPMEKNAGTIPHLHFNTFEASGEKEVRIPVFKNPADRAENIARAADFAEMYEAGTLPE